MLTTVTRKARYADFFVCIDVTRPFFIDVLGHLDHATRNYFGIKCVFTIGFDVTITVAVCTPLFRSDPFCHCAHQAIKVVFG